MCRSKITSVLSMLLLLATHLVAQGETDKQQPKIELLMEGPTHGQTGQQFSYILTVTNVGKAPLQNLKLQTLLHDGLIFDGAEPEGQYLEEQCEINWMIPRLEPTIHRKYQVKITYLEYGKIVNRARVVQGKEVLAVGRLETIIREGECGFAVNQYDSTDPVEVGQKTTYTSDICNTGFKDATDVRVVYTIPAESKFVSAAVEGVDGISYTVEERKISFDSVATIIPGQKITFRVTVEVLRAGDLLNTVEVMTKGSGKAITTQEGTKAFQ